MSARCATCAAAWGGQRTSHCMRCHQTFTGVSAFDRHQAARECREPETVGLVDAGRAYPCWGWPTADDWLEREATQ